MLKVSSEDISSHTSKLEAEYAKNLNAPLMFDKFCEKSFNRLYKNIGDEYPKRILIPKSLDEVMDGDLTPARVLELDKPIMYKDLLPIWTQSSLEEVHLTGVGYRNGDSRYPCDIGLGDRLIHAILGGITGHGKSVTLNSIISGIALEYAPWEVQMVLVDAKITEFKRYAREERLPHVRSIAATTDAEYIISVLGDLRREMDAVYNMFAKHGCNDIISFREKTKLCWPRVVIVVDEFQTMFTNAKRKASVIQDILDKFTRLGRAAGYHLVLSSQETEGVPSNTIGNIQVRMALGCTEKVSNSILGNPEGKINANKKGRLIINPLGSNGTIGDNIHYRVPFIPPPMLLDTFESLHGIAKGLGATQHLNFYDESDILRESKFLDFRKSKGNDRNKLYLGEPSFVMNDPDGDNTLRIEMTGNDIENILLYMPTSKSLSRYMLMFKYNMMVLEGQVHNFIFTADKRLAVELGLKDIAANVMDLRESEDPMFWQVWANLVYRRKLCLEADEIVFSDPTYSEASDKFFYQAVEQGSSLDTQLNRYRAHALMSLMLSQSYTNSMAYGVANNEADRVEAKIKELKACIEFYAKNNSEKEQLVYSKLTPLYYWIVSPDKVLGWGRDSKSSKVDRLKKLLLDAVYGNVRFILCSTNMEEISLKSAIGHLVMDGISAKQANQVGCPDYPEQVANVLGVYRNNIGENREAVKFKKMGFDGESFSS